MIHNFENKIKIKINRRTSHTLPHTHTHTHTHWHTYMHTRTHTTRERGRERGGEVAMHANTGYTNITHRQSKTDFLIAMHAHTAVHQQRKKN